MTRGAAAGWSAAVLICAWLAPEAEAQVASGTFKVICIANPSAADITGRKACLSSVPSLSFGSELTLAVEHAPDVDFDDSSEPNPADLILFLDGKPLPGTKAQVGKSQVDKDDVTTTLLTSVFGVIFLRQTHARTGRRYLSQRTAGRSW